ncbi:MAG TPA: flagellar FliJ family protein [Noviherbaspirillum sp.]
MKRERFRYVLEPVLLTRQWQRDALLAELGNANAEVAEQSRILAATENEINATIFDWKKGVSTSEGMTTARLHIANVYLRDLASRREEQRRKLVACEKKRDALADRVSRSHKELEAVESHKEKVRAEYRKMEMAAAIKESDDHWSMLQQHMESP